MAWLPTRPGEPCTWGLIPGVKKNIVFAPSFPEDPAKAFWRCVNSDASSACSSVLDVPTQSVWSKAQNNGQVNNQLHLIWTYYCNSFQSKLWDELIWFAFLKVCLTFPEEIPHISVMSDSVTQAWILQARILEGVAVPFSRGSSQPRHWTWVSCIAGRVFTIWATREALDFPTVPKSEVQKNTATERWFLSQFPLNCKLTLEQCGFELPGSTYTWPIFFKGKYHNTTWSGAGWIHGRAGSTDTEGWL